MLLTIIQVLAVVDVPVLQQLEHGRLLLWVLELVRIVLVLPLGVVRAVRVPSQSK